MSELDLNGKKVLIGLSGGINSMGVLCWLVESGMIPAELHLYYAHFEEHSPDTFQFVACGIRYARSKFKNVQVKVTRNKVLSFFEKENMIPHPVFSPCSRKLKIDPINCYINENLIDIDLIGYVKHEFARRANRQGKAVDVDMFTSKNYPIAAFSDEWCIEICDKHIGWHPKIYDIKDEKGKRVFKHNNCLPCKNMSIKDMKAVENHYPEYHAKAMSLSTRLRKHWGRNKDDFYFTFGRELGQESTCGNCVL